MKNDKRLVGKRLTAAKRVVFAAKWTGHKPVRTAPVLPIVFGRAKSLILPARGRGAESTVFGMKVVAVLSLIHI